MNPPPDHDDGFAAAGGEDAGNSSNGESKPVSGLKPDSGGRILAALTLYDGDGQVQSINEGNSSISSGLLRPGSRVHQYRLLGRLAIGGMGEVWKARDLHLGRDVAIKFMLRYTKRGLSRFSREAQLVAALDHAHIAKVYEYRTDPPFLAMQLVPGRPLTGAGRRSIKALRDSAMAIHHAHGRGVLHRDVKPGNILVADDGHATVVDFGLACSIDVGPQRTGSAVTISGEIVGTPAFMAPEQARGDLGTVTARTDVYGLGATLHCLLRDGDPPFDGATAFDIIEAVLQDEPPPTYGNRDLETIALKAMHKNPRLRYATAAEFADDLQRFLMREPILARRPSIWYRLQQSMLRRPTTWALSVALVIVMIIGTLTATSQFMLALEHRREVQVKDAESQRLSQEVSNYKNDLDAQRGQSKALQARAASAEAAHHRLIDLQETTERQRRRLRECEDIIARRVGSFERQGVDGALRSIVDEIQVVQSKHKGEAVLDFLLGEAHSLRSKEAQALAAYERALKGSQKTMVGGLPVRALVHLGRARLLVQERFFDDFAHRHLLLSERPSLESIKETVSKDLKVVEEYLADSYESEVLGLWSRYLADWQQPDDELHEQVASLAAQGGRRAESILLLQAILLTHRYPDDDGLRPALGRIDVALDRFYALPQGFLLRALLAYRLGLYADAESDAREALALRSTYPLAQLVLGLALSAQDAHAAAKEELDRAVALMPHEPMIWYHRGRAAQRRGDLVTAAKDYQRASRQAQLADHFMTDGVIWLSFARMLDQLRCPEQSLAAYEEAAFSARTAATDLEAIDVLLRSQQFESAASRSESLLSRWRQDPRQFALVARKRAEVLLSQDKLPAAQAVLFSALDRRPYDLGLRVDLAAAFMKSDGWRQALETLEAGVAWIRDRERRDQLADADRRDLEDHAAHVFRLRATVHRHMGETLVAIHDAEAALLRSNDAQRPAILVERARLHEISGEAEKARALLKEARQAWQQQIQQHRERFELLEIEALVKQARVLLHDRLFGHAALQSVKKVRWSLAPEVISIWSLGAH